MWYDECAFCTCTWQRIQTLATISLKTNDCQEKCGTSFIFAPVLDKRYGTWYRDLINSYPRQLVPRTTRTQDNSLPRQLVPRTTRTQDNSYPGQLCEISMMSQRRQVCKQHFSFIQIYCITHGCDVQCLSNQCVINASIWTIFFWYEIEQILITSQYKFWLQNHPCDIIIADWKRLEYFNNTDQLSDV